MKGLLEVMIYEKNIICQRINESINIKNKILEDENLINIIYGLVIELRECLLKKEGKLLICGNGGSASDALHMTGEIVGRFQRERNPYPAIALNADITTLTAIGNDYGYDTVFERPVEAYMTSKDIFIGISTSGNSENVYKAALKAKEKKGVTAALLGKDGGKIAKVVDYPIVIPSDITARIQESHITIIHVICEMLEIVL